MEPFDIDGYRQRLNLALGVPVQPAQGSGLVPTTNPGEPPVGPTDPNQPFLMAAADDRSGRTRFPPFKVNKIESQIAPPAPTRDVPPQPKPKLENGPADMKDDDFDQDKLLKAKTVADVTASMKPAARSRYMEWWETQYGSINDKYDQLRAEVGGPLNKRRKMSREDKFDLLLEFGLNLMRNSSVPSRDHSGDAGLAASETMMGHLQRRELEEPIRQSKLSQIEAMRGAELKGVGTYGEAMRAQSQLDRDEAAIEESKVRTKSGKIIDTEQGLYEFDGSELTQLTDPKSGAPLKGRAKTTGGGAGGRDGRTANQKNIADLVDRGVPEDLAVRIVYRQIQDPRKAASALYNILKQQYATDEEAREAASTMVESLYGGGLGAPPPIVPKREDVGPSPRSRLLMDEDPMGLR